MKVLLILCATSVLSLAQILPQQATRMISGNGAPSSGCTTIFDVGKMYVRKDAASVGASLFICSQIATSSFGWDVGGSGAMNMRQYGAVGDGTTNDASAVQAAVTAAIANGKEIYCPSGNFKLNSTITIANVAGFKFVGARGACKFSWGGDTSSPMLLIQDSSHGVFQGFNVLVSTSTQLKTVIQVENGSGSVVTPTANVFRDINIECTNGGCEYGIRIAQGAGGDNNNDFNEFDNVTVSNYTQAAATIEHSQSHYNLFKNCGFISNGLGNYGIAGFNGAAMVGGMTWQGGSIGYANVSAFYFGDLATPIKVSGGSFEGNDRWVLTAGLTSAKMPVELVDNRVTLNRANADRTIIKVLNPGPYIIRGCIFSNSTDGIIKFYFSGNGTPVYEMSNTMIYTTDTTTSAIFCVSGCASAGVVPGNLTGTTARNPNTQAETTLGGLSVTGLTAAQVLFGNNTIGQSANFTWDNANNRLKVGTTVDTTRPLSVGGAIGMVGASSVARACVGPPAYDTSHAAVWNCTLADSSAGNIALSQNSSGDTILQAASGRSIGIRINNGADAIKINSSGFLQLPQRTPSSAAASCIANEFAVDANFLYYCGATNTWKRVGLATW